MAGLRAALGVAALLAAAAPAAAQPGAGQPQRMAPPKWLDDEGKEVFSDLEAEEDGFGDNACELREKLLKKMAGKGDKDASEHRARVLLGIGFCTLKRGDYAMSKSRFESAISEMNFPSEDFIMQNQQVAHLGLIKQAAQHLHKHEATLAATALRRCREVLDRNLKKILKMVHKQMPAGQAPPLEAMMEELPGLGKTGQILPLIVKQVPILQQDLGFAEVVEQVLTDLDRRMAAVDTSLKGKRLRLDTTKGKAKGGLMYVRALLSEAVVPAERSGAVQELAAAGGLESFVQEAGAMEKGLTLIKRSKEGTGCKDGKGMEKTCKALTAVADIASNGFGETRLVAVKGGKPQALDVCETNANIAILVAAKDGVTAKIKDVAEPVALPAGEAVVVDYCREIMLTSSSTVAVLFAQAWHPEFAAVERSTELRTRAKAFGLSEHEVKAATKVVNDAAKKGWEKTAALWRQDSAGHRAMQEALQGEQQERARKAEEAAEAKRAEEEAGDEEKKKALEELERKRIEKRKREEAAEEARLKRKKQLEEERAKRDPWLNFPSVLDAEKKLDEMKEARRDANAKLEFELSTQLTKDISAQERALKKAIKAAKKLHKKGGTAEDDAKLLKEKSAAAAEEAPAEAPAKGGKGKEAKAKAEVGGKELKDLRAKLDAVKKKKQAAAEAEDYKTAKKLKAEQDELEKKIKQLEKKSEL